MSPQITAWELRQIENFRRLMAEYHMVETDLEFSEADIRFMLKIRKLRQCGEKLVMVHIDDAPAIRRVSKRESV